MRLKLYFYTFFWLLPCYVFAQNNSTYCTPPYQICVAESISNVTIKQGTNVLLNNNSGCSTNGYSYYNTPVLTLIRNNIYSVTLDCLDNENGTSVNAYIDYNQNGVFEASEIISQNYLFSSSYEVNFTIPSNSLSGQTRMRIWASWNSIWGLDGAGSCEMNYGEVEDYLVNIVCPTTDNYSGNQLAGTYKVSQNIESTANISTNTYYQAGKSILLKAGFQAGGNELFQAKIAGCN